MLLVASTLWKASLPAAVSGGEQCRKSSLTLFPNGYFKSSAGAHYIIALIFCEFFR